MTKAQRQHAQEARGLLALRKAAARYAVVDEAFQGQAMEAPIEPQLVSLGMLVEATRELEAAAHGYANALTARERRKLARRVK